MALKGNLRDFSTVQLLNLVHLARKTGTLAIEGPDEAAWIYFRDGKLSYAQLGQSDNSLVTILLNAKKINPAQHKIIRERAGQMSDKELGLLLINANYLTQQDVLACIKAHYFGIVNRLFTWTQGLFSFDTQLAPPDEKITIQASLENLIFEGSRRRREWEHLQDEIPSLDMALKFVERPGTSIRNINLTTEDWRIVNYINPRNTMRQIARATRVSDLEMRRVVYGLIEAGLVEIIRPEGKPAPPRVPSDHFPIKSVVTNHTTNKAERKSLINRIISRIRSL